MYFYLFDLFILFDSWVRMRRKISYTHGPPASGSTTVLLSIHPSFEAPIRVYLIHCYCKCSPHSAVRGGELTLMHTIVTLPLVEPTKGLINPFF